MASTERALLVNTKKTLLVSIACVFVLFFSLVAHSAKVDGVRVWRAPDNTRLVFDLSAPVDHKLFALKNPSRLVLDIPKTTMRADLANLALESTPITTLRHGVQNKADLRVVLDLNAKVKPKSFFLKKHGGKPDRLVIDLEDAAKATRKTVETALTEKQQTKRDIIVAIDAGHGGEDPGALGPNRIKEKDVVLPIAKELARLINAERGFKAHLIRTSDYYIPLKKRRNKARQLRADIFVSIHADAFTDKRARGASVFALSRKGASSESARYLASRENEADLIGGAGDVDIVDLDSGVAEVILDLSMTSTLASSLDVGARVLKNIGNITRLHKDYVEQAGFLVLKSPDVPSILVETGFISNPGEAKKLATKSHQQALANSMYKGIKSYFYDKPPEGSLIAWQQSGAGRLQYTIARGDTLSGIAKKYRVTVDEIKRLNQLSSSAIRVGQKITIPSS